MENILDRSASYLSIFVKPFEVDSNLPKWSQIVKENKKDVDQIISKYPFPVTTGKTIKITDFIHLNNKDFNIYVGKSLVERIKKDQNIFFDNSLALLTPDEEKPEKVSLFKRLYRKFFGKNKTEELYEFDVIKFFELVKLTTKESAKDYIDRIQPYIIALKKADTSGQTALADMLKAQIFTAKYESLLHAEGFNYKITEEQLVSFVKKAEKGVRLDYIKNFTHNIPDEVLAKKYKADSLLVFDNYCILYYDPDTKAYKLTKEEEEKERQKKADPILFGMIQGSHNLYYIADWIDEYCDLTLDEFIRVSGLDKEQISIDETIKL